MKCFKCVGCQQSYHLQCTDLSDSFYQKYGKNNLQSSTLATYFPKMAKFSVFGKFFPFLENFSLKLSQLLWSNNHI